LTFLKYILPFVVLPSTLLLGCNQDTEENPQETAKDIRAEVWRLSAALELTQERFKDTRIRAPFGGVVSKRPVDPGDYVF